MNIFINPLSDKGAPVLQTKPSGSPISLLRFKRGSSVPLTVTLVGVTEAGNLRIGMKRRDRYESPLLAYAAAATPDEAEGSGETSPTEVRFTLLLHVNSEELDNALGVGAGDSADVPGAVPAVTEICWEENGTPRISDSVPTVIANDIVRMTEDAPQSEQGSYPLPELLATKGWVNDLHAGAGQYGLVELEDGTTLQDGHYTAVALTESGCIAVPAATSSLRGTVKLGTARKLPGDSVLLPVGERASDGGLAVDASGLSAYAVARKNGFEGTEQEWLESLKGEPGPLGEVDPAPAEDSPNAVGSGGVFAALAAKQERLPDMAVWFTLRAYFSGLAPANAPVIRPTGTIPSPQAGWSFLTLPPGFCKGGAVHAVALNLIRGNTALPVYLALYQQPEEGGDDPAAWPLLAVSEMMVVRATSSGYIEWSFAAPVETIPGRKLCVAAYSAAPTAWGPDARLMTAQTGLSYDKDCQFDDHTRPYYMPDIKVQRSTAFSEAAQLHLSDTTLHLPDGAYSALTSLLPAATSPESGSGAAITAGAVYAALAERDAAISALSAAPVPEPLPEDNVLRHGHTYRASAPAGGWLRLDEYDLEENAVVTLWLDTEQSTGLWFDMMLAWNREPAFVKGHGYVIELRRVGSVVLADTLHSYALPEPSTE